MNFSTSNCVCNRLKVKRIAVLHDKGDYGKGLAEYAKKLNLFDSQIRDTEANLGYFDDQEEELLDTVATVRGTISLSWISIWNIAYLYFPLYWLSLILIVTAVAAYIVHRRRFQFLI